MPHQWLLALVALFGAVSSVSESARARNHRYSNKSTAVEILSPQGPATYLNTKKNVSDESQLDDVLFIINRASQGANQTHLAVNLKKTVNVTGDGAAAAEQRLFWHPHHPNNCPNHPFPPSGPYLPAPPPPPSVVPCGGTFLSPTSVLVSPNHPGPYPPNSKCLYKVKVPLLAPACLRVSIAHLAIRWTPNCVQDWMKIGEEQPRLCGGIAGEKFFRVEGGFFPVYFRSGSLAGPPQSGFKIIISRVSCQSLIPARPPPGPPRPPAPLLPPPVHRPNPYRWRWLWLLKCEWGGIKTLPPGHCPPPVPPHDHQPPRLPPPLPPPRDTSKSEPQAPTMPGPLCNRVTSAAEFVTVSSEWLPSVREIGKHWSCRLSVYKAHPDACELQLNLESLKLDCRQEWVEVDGQRICGEQPLRQLTVDFRGPEARIDYRNMGSKLPGTFLVRGQQSFECSSLDLGVIPVKKLATAVPPSPAGSGNYVSHPITQNQQWRNEKK